MTKRIAIVDQRPDMLEFLKEQIEARCYEVLTAFTEDEADVIHPEPALVFLDFKPRVDLAEVIHAIEKQLKAPDV